MNHGMEDLRNHWAARVVAIAVAIFILGQAQAQTPVGGIVMNATTGQPQPGVLVTLVGFAGGMSPVEEARSGPDGHFVFQKSLPEVPPNQPMKGMLRAEFDGASYSELIRAGMALNDLRISVYSVSSVNVPAPENRVMIFEPGTGEMVVNESFLYNNTSQPPRTFRDAEHGTLRFYLPAAAKGIVQVSLMGPAGMPLKSSADPTGESNIYKVDFPLKPGENRIDLSYVTPYGENTVFETRVLYPGLSTRIAAPAGVTITGDSLTQMGVEPRTQATLFEAPSDAPLQLTISGQGRLGPAAGAETESAGGEGGGGSEGGGGGLRIAPAPVAKELKWVLVLACGILGVGFFHLLTTSKAGTDASLRETAGNPSQPQAVGQSRRKAASRKG
jgi:uncharacterized membrane protein YgcG